MAESVVNAQGISELTRYSGQTTATHATKELGKDDFLQLLVAKLQHQDPLDPQADEDFIAQMAQFSSLEQLSNMNENLTENLKWNYLQSQTINNTMATSLLGRTVSSTSNEIYYAGGSEDVKASFTLSSFADTASVKIYNGNGELVNTYAMDDLGAGNQVFTWNGLNSSGIKASAGTYTFQVEAKDVSGNAVSAVPYKKGTVESVHYINGQAFLVVDGTRVPLGAVVEIGTDGDNG